MSARVRVNSVTNQTSDSVNYINVYFLLVLIFQNVLFSHSKRFLCISNDLIKVQNFEIAKIKIFFTSTYRAIKGEYLIRPRSLTREKTYGIRTKLCNYLNTFDLSVHEVVHVNMSTLYTVCADRS